MSWSMKGYRCRGDLQTSGNLHIVQVNIHGYARHQTYLRYVAVVHLRPEILVLSVK